MTQLIVKWENLDTANIPASTPFLVGDFMSYNIPAGLGEVIPCASLPLQPIMGCNLLAVSSTDFNYSATNKFTNYQRSKEDARFLVPVGAGTAVLTMEGSVFNVYSGNSGQIDLSSYSNLSYNTLAVSTFAVGHTITGGTSGATGVITVVAPGQLVFTVTAGTFVTGETITDGTSGATAKITTVGVGGTQLRVEKVLSATQVICSVALTA